MKSEYIKLFGVIILSLFMISLISAQNIEDIEVFAGTSTEYDYSLITSTASETLGAIISNCYLENTDYVSFLGQNVWEEITQNQVQDFVLYLTAPNEVPNFLSLTQLGLFEESLDIPLRTASSHIYQTMSEEFLNELADYQNVKPLDSFYPIQKDGLGLRVKLLPDGNNPLLMSYQVETFPKHDLDNIAVCDMGTCPNAIKVFDDEGINYDSVFSARFKDFIIDGEVPQKKVFFTTWDGKPDLVESAWLVDYNDDGVFEHSELMSLKSSVSHEGESLIFDEVGVRDLWIEIQ